MVAKIVLYGKLTQVYVMAHMNNVVYITVCVTKIIHSKLLLLGFLILIFVFLNTYIYIYIIYTDYRCNDTQFGCINILLYLYHDTAIYCTMCELADF